MTENKRKSDTSLSASTTFFAAGSDEKNNGEKKDFQDDNGKNPTLTVNTVLPGVIPESANAETDQDSSSTAASSQVPTAGNKVVKTAVTTTTAKRKNWIENITSSFRGNTNNDNKNQQQQEKAKRSSSTVFQRSPKGADEGTVKSMIAAFESDEKDKRKEKKEDGNTESLLSSSPASTPSVITKVNKNVKGQTKEKSNKNKVQQRNETGKLSSSLNFSSPLQKEEESGEQQQNEDPDTENTSSEFEEGFDMIEEEDIIDYVDEQQQQEEKNDKSRSLFDENEIEKNAACFHCLSPEEYQEKLEQIHSCFNGEQSSYTNNETTTENTEDESVVNLWQLRTLAITRGGLLNPSIRQKIWPKLVGIDGRIHFLGFNDNGDEESDCSSSREAAKRMIQLLSLILEELKGKGMISLTSSLKEGTKIDREIYLKLSSQEVDIIQKDVKRSVWHVEKELKRCIQYFSEEKEVKQEEEQNLSNLLWNVLSFNPPDSHWSEQGSSSKSSLSEALPSSPRQSKAEFEVMQTILSCILQCPPPSSENNNDDGGKNDNNKICPKDKLHYYQGLHDITSLFLTTVQSPSITALLLHRLSSHYLKDAMSSTFQNVHYAIRTTFALLLHKLDYELYTVLYHDDVGMKDPIFAFSWIVTWFAHDVLDLGVAARLVDFFLCSHPLMPVYLSVCVLAYPMNRCRILQAEPDFATLHMVLSNLLGDMEKAEKSDCGSNKSLMVMFEEIIEMSLSLIRRVPPKKLSSLAQSYEEDPALVSAFAEMTPSIALFRDLPSWSRAPAAPTDRELSQEENNMRSLSPADRMEHYRALSEKYVKMESLRGNNYDNADQSKLSSKRKNWHLFFTSKSATSKSNCFTIAMDAAGLGNGVDDEEDIRKRRKKRRLRRRRRAVTLVGIAVVGGVVAFYYNHYEPQPPVEEKLPPALPLEATPEIHEAIVMEANYDDSSSLPAETNGTNSDISQVEHENIVDDDQLDNLTAEILDEGDKEMAEELLAIDDTSEQDSLSNNCFSTTKEEPEQIEGDNLGLSSGTVATPDISDKDEEAEKQVSLPTKDSNIANKQRIRKVVKGVHRFGGVVKESLLKNEAMVVFL